MWTNLEPSQVKNSRLWTYVFRKGKPCLGIGLPALSKVKPIYDGSLSVFSCGRDGAYSMLTLGTKLRSVSVKQRKTADCHINHTPSGCLSSQAWEPEAHTPLEMWKKTFQPERHCRVVIGGRWEVWYLKCFPVVYLLTRALIYICLTFLKNSLSLIKKSEKSEGWDVGKRGCDCGSGSSPSISSHALPCTCRKWGTVSMDVILTLSWGLDNCIAVWDHFLYKHLAGLCTRLPCCERQ